MPKSSEKKLAYQRERNKATGYADQIEYAKNNLKRVAFNLNKNTDADLIAFLESMPNKQGYLKDLVRADMEKKSNTKS